MGERGPAKKPAATHKRNGTFREDRHGGAQLPVKLPAPPRDMTKEAKKHWRAIGKQLERAGYVSEIDSVALRGLCEFFERYLQAKSHIDEHGLTVTHYFKDGQKEVANPSVAIAKESWGEVVKLLKQFGMTPSSRTGLPVAESAAADDTDAILGLKVVG